jgi:ankyrin repeat protein
MEHGMKKYIQKKLLGRMGCGLVVVMGFAGNLAHGSRGAAVSGQVGPQALPTAMDGNQRIPGDPNGDTEYLRAVRAGNLEMVRLFLANQLLDFNAQDNEGNTDLMIALRGGWHRGREPNCWEIFNLIVQRGRRNWNLRDTAGETALLLAVRLGLMEAVDALLQIDAVDPNIPGRDGITPLIAAIGNVFEPQELRIGMALLLITCPRVNVNQRGADGKLSLQIALEAGLPPELFEAICRRSLEGCDAKIKELMVEVIKLVVSFLPCNGDLWQNPELDLKEEMAHALLVWDVGDPEDFNQKVVEHVGGVISFYQETANSPITVSPKTHKVFLDLVALWNDPEFNVDNYGARPLNQLFDMVNRKIGFLLAGLQIDDDAPMDLIQGLAFVASQLTKVYCDISSIGRHLGRQIL